MNKYLHSIALLTLLMCYLTVTPQPATLHQMSCYNNSDSVLKELVSKYQLKNQYTFGVLLPLGGCPRCEGAIKPFYDRLEQNFPNDDKVMFFVYSKKPAALDFIKKRDYGFKQMIFFKPDSLSHIFHFSTKEAQVPFFFILDNINGKLIKTATTLGLAYNDTFFDNFTDINNESYKIKPITKPKNDTLSNNESPVFAKLNVAFGRRNGIWKPEQTNILNNFRYFVIDESEQILSNIGNFALSNDEKNLIIGDHLSSNFFWYTKKDSTYLFKKIIKLDRATELSFIANDIPQSIVDYAEQINILHTMYLNSSLCNDVLNITASLPNLFWEDKVTENIGYKNTPVVISGKLSKNLEDMKIVELKIGNNSLSCSHTAIFTDNSSDYYLCPIEKGWPVSGTESKPTTEESNPFNQSFYNEAFALAVFNKTGEYHSSVGRLPQWYQQNLTGYYYYKPIVKFTKPDQIYLGDALTGQIYDVNLKTNESKMVTDLFNLQTNNDEAKVNRDSMPLQYIFEKEKYLTYQLEDFIVDGEILYAIVSDKNDLYIMTKRNLKKMTTEGDFIIPTNFNGFNIHQPKLIIDNGAIKIISLGINNFDQQVVIIGDTKTTLK